MSDAGCEFSGEGQRPEQGGHGEPAAHGGSAALMLALGSVVAVVLACTRACIGPSPTLGGLFVARALGSDLFLGVDCIATVPTSELSPHFI